MGRTRSSFNTGFVWTGPLCLSGYWTESCDTNSDLGSFWGSHGESVWGMNNDDDDVEEEEYDDEEGHRHENDGHRREVWTGPRWRGGHLLWLKVYELSRLLSCCKRACIIPALLRDTGRVWDFRSCAMGPAPSWFLMRKRDTVRKGGRLPAWPGLVKQSTEPHSGVFLSGVFYQS